MSEEPLRVVEEWMRPIRRLGVEQCLPMVSSGNGPRNPVRKDRKEKSDGR